MSRLKRAALLTELIERLRDEGSWCGETHIQKAVFFLEELGRVPLSFDDYVIYKHGPFSFDLRDFLAELRADQLLELHVQPYPYGPSLIPTEASKDLRAGFPKTLTKHARAIDFVAKKIDGKKVAELEELGTALYLIREYPDASPARLAKLLHERKPHVSLEVARRAVGEVRDMLAEIGVGAHSAS